MPAAVCTAPTAALRRWAARGWLSHRAPARAGGRVIRARHRSGGVGSETLVGPGTRGRHVQQTRENIAAYDRHENIPAQAGPPGPHELLPYAPARLSPPLRDGRYRQKTVGTKNYVPGLDSQSCVTVPSFSRWAQSHASELDPREIRDRVTPATAPSFVADHASALLAGEARDRHTAL